MLRKLLTFLLAAGVLAAPAAAGRLIMPEVTYDKQVQLTRRGPVALHVVTAPRPTGDYRLEVTLSNGIVSGREALTAIQRRAGVPVVGLSGDFSFSDGRPFGIVVRNRVLAYGPDPDRASLGIDAAGNLKIARVAMRATWNGTGQRRPLGGINRPPSRNGVTLYTPAWGGATPPANDTVEVVVAGLPAVAPNTELAGRASEVRRGGAHPIPADGAVLVGRGTGAQTLVQEARVDTTIGVRFPLAPTPDWGDVVDAVGGGPELVRGGRAIFRVRETFGPLLLATRQPRAAVGQRADGRILFVVADGGSRGYSVGVTNSELARAVVRLGAVTAFAVAPGTPVSVASDARLLNRPVRSGGALLADALLLRYRVAR